MKKKAEVNLNTLAKQERLIGEIKALLDEHDRAETRLIAAVRAQQPTGLLWRDHDRLERAIINTAAQLPPAIAKKIQRGDL